MKFNFSDESQTLDTSAPYTSYGDDPQMYFLTNCKGSWNCLSKDAISSCLILKQLTLKSVFIHIFFVSLSFYSLIYKD